MCIPIFWIGLKRAKIPTESTCAASEFSLLQSFLTASRASLFPLLFYPRGERRTNNRVEKKHLRVWSPWPPGPTPLTHGPLRDRSPPLVVVSPRLSVLFLSLCAKSSQVQARCSRPRINSCTQNRHVFFRLIGSVALCKARLLDLHSSCAALETTKSTTTTPTTQKRQENYWLCRSLLFCFRCHLRSMFVEKKKKKEVCQSSFCEILWYRCTENIWNEKFYGCEKLYVTELLYERKRKAREKENFTAAPPTELLRDCVLYLLLFLLGSSRHQGGPETGSECVQLPLVSSFPPAVPRPNDFLNPRPLPDSSASAPGNQ